MCDNSLLLEETCNPGTNHVRDGFYSTNSDATWLKMAELLWFGYKMGRIPHCYSLKLLRKLYDVFSSKIVTIEMKNKFLNTVAKVQCINYLWFWKSKYWFSRYIDSMSDHEDKQIEKMYDILVQEEKGKVNTIIIGDF